ncbi:hypothetical protein PLESTM_002003500 [Pleodorina starrii]|nr:hypothetical protein PLESTM_002003500 [Pleodorina starrii]
MQSLRAATMAVSSGFATALPSTRGTPLVVPARQARSFGRPIAAAALPSGGNPPRRRLLRRKLRPWGADVGDDDDGQREADREEAPMSLAALSKSKGQLQHYQSQHGRSRPSGVHPPSGRPSQQPVHPSSPVEAPVARATIGGTTTSSTSSGYAGAQLQAFGPGSGPESAANVTPGIGPGSEPEPDAEQELAPLHPPVAFRTAAELRRMLQAHQARPKPDQSDHPDAFNMAGSSNSGSSSRAGGSSSSSSRAGGSSSSRGNELHLVSEAADSGTASASAPAGLASSHRLQRGLEPAGTWAGGRDGDRDRGPATGSDAAFGGAARQQQRQQQHREGEGGGDLGPASTAVPYTVTPLEQEALNEDRDYQKAKRLALSLLQRSPLPTGELSRRLLARGHLPRVVSPLLAWLAAGGALNDRLYARLYAQSKWNSNLIAPAKIKKELAVQGVAAEDVAAALAHVFGPTRRIRLTGPATPEERGVREALLEGARRHVGRRNGAEPDAAASSPTRSPLPKADGGVGSSGSRGRVGAPAAAAVSDRIKERVAKRRRLASWLQYRGHEMELVLRVFELLDM